MHLPSWQAQIKGQKRWTLQTPTECLHECQHTYEVDVSPGDISMFILSKKHKVTLNGMISNSSYKKK